MSILKVVQEAKLPAFDKLPSLDSLPPVIKGKVCFITKLIEKAILLFNAKQTFPEKISVDSFLNCTSAHDENQDEHSEILNKLFKPLYPKESDDFDTHLKKLKARPKLIFEILKIINEVCPEYCQKIFNKMNEGLTQYSNNELMNRYCDNIELMGKPDYEPCTELPELAAMLQELLFYWLTWPLSTIAIISAFLKPVETPMAGLKDQDLGLDIEAAKAVEAALDLSLAKIAYQVGVKTALIHQWGRREGDRNLKASQRKKANKATNAQPVIETFHSLKFPKDAFPKGVSLNKVAGMIKEHLTGKIKDPPSIYTINRVLRNDEEIWKKFKPKGRNYIIEQM